MKLTMLGSCSGTEPMSNRKHTAFVIEHEGGVYWFDAGEGCSYTAHVIGIDILSIRALFISHPHLDHVGGLANLLWTIRKLEGRSENPARSMQGQTLPVRIPNLRVWQGALDVLQGPAEALNWNRTLDAQTYQDGVIFNQDGLKVTALHNRHLGDPPPGSPWQSFSFRIDTASSAIVFSGDVRHVSEARPLIGEGCDLFLMETGHHAVEEVCTYLKDNRVPFGELGFVHHGRAILADPEGECKKARAILGNRVFVADDGTVKKL